MQRVSVRTLTLLVELLTVVITYQWIGWTAPSWPDAVWLASNSATVERCCSPEPNCAVDG
jgi:hypothetical protein